MEPDRSLLGSAYTQDPYPVHALLREQPGLSWHPPWGAWVASRYEDVADALRRDGVELSAVGQTSAALDHLPVQDRSSLTTLERLFSSGLLWSDPPEHERIRAVVNKALNPRDLERMSPRVGARTARVVGGLPRRGPFDVVASLADEVPIAVLAELLGIPDADVPRIRSWADTLADLMGSPHPTVEQARAAQDAVLEARTYVDLVASGLGRPGVITRLAGLRASGAVMTDDEFHATVVVLLVGGHRTTAAAISSAILELAHHPDQRAALSADPTLLSRAVEEFLRIESPHQRTVRIVRRATVLAGTRLTPGDVVVLLNGSANRDVAQFAGATELQLDRRPNRHLAFSSGIHFCIGAPIARIELAETIRAFLGRYPDFTLARPPEWLDNHTLRAPTSLWIDPSSP